MCCWFKCEHEYATIPSVKMTLTIEPNCKFLCKKIKLLSHDENHSKFNIFFTLGLKVTKSPSRNFTHRKLSNCIMNLPEFLFKFFFINFDGFKMKILSNIQYLLHISLNINKPPSCTFTNQ